MKNNEKLEKVRFNEDLTLYNHSLKIICSHGKKTLFRFIPTKNSIFSYSNASGGSEFVNS